MHTRKSILEDCSPKTAFALGMRLVNESGKNLVDLNKT